MNGTLFVVATPIGNLQDLSPRAIDTLKNVDLVACEDTRHTKRLFHHFGIDTPTISYHDHNEEQRSVQLIDKLRSGLNLAIVSDAGTPLLSDPGFRIVRACREEGIPVIPVPGPFAAAAAVSVSGLPTDRVLFLGFLPKKATHQRKFLKSVSSSNATLSLYLSPHRLQQTLQAILETLGDRNAFAVREMTKLHETGYWGSLSEITELLSQETPRGEFTLVIEGLPESAEAPPINLNIAAYALGLEKALKMSQNEAIKLAAEHLGVPKRDVYNSVLKYLGKA